MATLYENTMNRKEHNTKRVAREVRLLDSMSPNTIFKYLLSRYSFERLSELLLQANKEDTRHIKNVMYDKEYKNKEERMDIKKTYRVFKTQQQRDLISDIIYETLKECDTPEQRSVISKLNSNIIKKWDEGILNLNEINELTNCFDREREEKK